MKQQYEQQCNAAALADMGVPVVRGLKNKHLARIDDWLHRGRPVPVHYPDRTSEVLDQLLAEQLGVPRPQPAALTL